MGWQPSTLAFLVSIRTRLGIPRICSSALSSMVISRSSAGIKPASAFRNVVLPLPVPPLIKILYLAFTSFSRKLHASSLMDPISSSSLIPIGCSGKRLMVTTGQLRAMGPSTTLTREPFSSLASTIGEVSFTTLLQPATICCMTSCSFSPDSKPQGQAKSLPALSTKIPSIPLIIISVTCSSSISSCSTSNPRMVKNSSFPILARSYTLSLPANSLARSRSAMASCISSSDISLVKSMSERSSRLIPSLTARYFSCSICRYPPFCLLLSVRTCSHSSV